MANAKRTTNTTPKSAAPTGLSITRNGDWFTLSWKFGAKDYNDGQSFQYRINNGGWKSVAIGKTAKSKAIKIPAASYYPYGSTIWAVSMRVRGNQAKYTKGSGKKKKTYNPTMSNWATKTYTIYAPKKPGASVARSETLSNVATFSWSVEAAGSGNSTWFNRVYWQTMLVKDCNITDGSKLTWNNKQLGWETGTGGSTGSKVITEESEIIATGSYTRWFRIISQGPRGASAYTYAKWVYAIPFQAKNVTANAQVVPAGGYLCTVNWTSDSNAAHPISETHLQYAMATPNAGMACPDGASWQDANVSKDTGGGDAASFSIDSLLGLDQCLFVRVNNIYDGKTTYGLPVLADVGYLKDPTNLTVQTDQTTYRATITANNASDVPDSFLAVSYLTDSDPEGFVIGIIPHGIQSVTVQCPNWTGAKSVAFSVRAIVGSYEKVTREDGIDSYIVVTRMQSENDLVDGGAVPLPPANVGIVSTNNPGTIRVTWDWTWDGANSAEISWADHDDAWESTDEPSTYTISNLHASAWNISGLETGKPWYVRVRLLLSSGDNSTYGPWSDMQKIDLASAPAVPVLVLSEGVITETGAVTASWVYSTTDGSNQAFAEIAEYTVEEGEPVYTPITQVQTAQHVTLSASDLGWTSGESHQLVVRVQSASGRVSDDWSNPVGIVIADPLEIEIASTSLVDQTVTIEEIDYTYKALVEMPFLITVTGAGDYGTTSVVIERTTAYDIDRPNETAIHGYAGETIAIVTQTGEAPITIDRSMLIGHLDDEAHYRVVATIQDSLGQSSEASIDFEVHWTHQALMPEAQVTIDENSLIAILTPIAPTGVGVGDVCDIYRLSVDKPELIVEGATWGEQYVDPYPTLGEYGGHRFVYRTIDGDYITVDNKLAWIDLQEDDGDIVDSPANIIEFGLGRVELQYDVDLSSSWTKDFTETQYLGGSVQGDWNPAVSRTGSIKSVGVTTQDQETIEAMRRLATWAGICHVRTKDGSSYAADVQVSEDYNVDTAHKVASFNLSITRVDAEDLDGMTLAEWNAVHAEEPEGE